MIELSSGESQIIRSPNHPGAVPVDRECVWLVKVGLLSPAAVLLVDVPREDRGLPSTQ